MQDAITSVINAADVQENRKIATYANLSTCHSFHPVAVETLGSWGEMSLRFLKDVGKRLPS